MTIEEINAVALDASIAGDLETLKAALNHRAAAIEELLRNQPAQERILNAIRAGQVIAQHLHALRASMSRIDLLG
jgi:hypothetical protein